MSSTAHGPAWDSRYGVRSAPLAVTAVMRSVCFLAVVDV